jgi:hypothetical protein
MARPLMILALLLSLTAPAGARTLIKLERGVALTLAGVKLPTADGGTVSFKTCADCAYRTHRTMDATVYLANGRSLPLPDFLRVVEEIYERAGAAENDAVVAVFLDIASERVTRVTLNY